MLARAPSILHLIQSAPPITQLGSQESHGISFLKVAVIAGQLMPELISLDLFSFME
jgi:hypothetical protein